MTLPNPGDFAVINVGSDVTDWIVGAERLDDLVNKVADWEQAKWDHAVICSRVVAGKVFIVEAEPGGAVETVWHYEGRPHKWSTGIIDTPEAAGEAARKYIGTDYSYLDYLALTLYGLHIRIPWVKNRVASSKHMICSQLVDQAERDAGLDLFGDGLWPGYVKPSDLGHLLGV